MRHRTHYCFERVTSLGAVRWSSFVAPDVWFICRGLCLPRFICRDATVLNPVRLFHQPQNQFTWPITIGVGLIQKVPFKFCHDFNMLGPSWLPLFLFLQGWWWCGYFFHERPKSCSPGNPCHQLPFRCSSASAGWWWCPWSHVVYFPSTYLDLLCFAPLQCHSMCGDVCE